MSKYQEALNRIIDEYIPMHYEGKPMNRQTEDALLLQELVDKAKPMKIYHDKDEEPFCPNCKTNNRIMTFEYDCRDRYENYYCGNCGQRLDWSEKE